MAVTTLHVPTTKTQALTTNYLANDFQVRSARNVEIWISDAAIAFTVRYQYAGGDQVERVVGAGGSRYIAGTGDRGTVLNVNVKSASGTPTAHIIVT